MRLGWLPGHLQEKERDIAWGKKSSFNSEIILFFSFYWLLRNYVRNLSNIFIQFILLIIKKLNAELKQFFLYNAVGFFLKN